MASPYQQPKPTPGVKVLGRPAGSCNRESKTDSFRLSCILPKEVLQALIEAERTDHVYRTRVAANVLCDWARRQNANRSRD